MILFIIFVNKIKVHHAATEIKINVWVYLVIYGNNAVLTCRDILYSLGYSTRVNGVYDVFIECAALVYWTVISMTICDFILFDINSKSTDDPMLAPVRIFYG